MHDVVTLPENEQAFLRELFATDMDAFVRRLRKLRDADWPLRAIGDVVRRGRSTIQMWERSEWGEIPHDRVDSEPIPSKPEPVQRKLIRRPIHVPDEIATELQELGTVARAARRSQEGDSSAWAVGEKLNQRLHELRKIYSLAALARAMDVTRRVISLRVDYAENGRDPVVPHLSRIPPSKREHYLELADERYKPTDDQALRHKRAYRLFLTDKSKKKTNA